MVRSERSAVDLGVVLNQGAVSVAGRRGKRPVLGQLAAAPPASVMQTGRGFWAKGEDGYPHLFTLTPTRDSGGSSRTHTTTHDASRIWRARSFFLFIILSRSPPVTNTR